MLEEYIAFRALGGPWQVPDLGCACLLPFNRLTTTQRRKPQGQKWRQIPVGRGPPIHIKNYVELHLQHCGTRCACFLGERDPSIARPPQACVVPCPDCLQRDRCPESGHTSDNSGTLVPDKPNGLDVRLLRMLSVGDGEPWHCCAL